MFFRVNVTYITTSAGNLEPSACCVNFGLIFEKHLNNFIPLDGRLKCESMPLLDHTGETR